MWHNIFDLERFLSENEGVDLSWTCKQTNKLSEKWRMFAYYHGPLLDCAVIALTRAGYSGVDKVKADYIIRAEFAKDFIIKPNGETQVIMLDKSGMNKQRLHKLLTDAIHWLEEEFQQECPDSQEWKMQKITNRNIRRIE